MTRRILAIAALCAVVAVAAAPAALAKGPVHPSKAYCKKHAKHLNKKQRAWCKRKKKHRTTTPHHVTAPVAGGPLTQPPAVDPTLGSTTPSATTPAPTVAPARLAVSAKEFSLTLSRATLAAGPAIVELHNGGEDPHNLRIESLDGGTAPIDYPITSPGQVSSQRMTLPAGSYKLYCTLSTHDAQGMHATLTVGP